MVMYSYSERRTPTEFYTIIRNTMRHSWVRAEGDHRRVTTRREAWEVEANGEKGTDWRAVLGGRCSYTCDGGSQKREEAHHRPQE